MYISAATCHSGALLLDMSRIRGKLDYYLTPEIKPSMLAKVSIDSMAEIFNLFSKKKKLKNFKSNLTGINDCGARPPIFWMANRSLADIHHLV